MKIVFVSNYLNHHQVPLCEAFINTGNEFSFIALEPIAEYRLKLGYADLNHKYDYVINCYETEVDKKTAIKKCKECDILINGGDAKWLSDYVKTECVRFLYSERIFKEKNKPIKNLFRSVKYRLKRKEYANYYLLCASGYAASDYNKVGLFKNRTFKWGYFPQVKEYLSKSVIEKKKQNSILWVGRFLEWKHPEVMINLARKLNEEQIDYDINMIGTGPIEDQIEEKIKSSNLTQRIHLLGAMSPEEVRIYMEQSAIFIFSSDQNEGWGAVLNESMNSCCAVVASEEIGAVPYLIDEGKNGVTYNYYDEDKLFANVKEILNSKEKQALLGMNAYLKIQKEWNAHTAAERLLVLANNLSSGLDTPFEDGICSKA